MNRDIEPGEKIRFIATMTSPVNANLIAWNSVAMSGGSMLNGKVSYLLPNEAPKVGINVSSDVELTKTVARAKMNGDEPVRDANGVIETVESDEVVMPGDYMLYKVNLKAKGPAVASGMNVADALPSGVEYVSSETRVCQDGATNRARARSMRPLPTMRRPVPGQRWSPAFSIPTSTLVVPRRCTSS